MQQTSDVQIARVASINGSTTQNNTLLRVQPIRFAVMRGKTTPVEGAAHARHGV